MSDEFVRSRRAIAHYASQTVANSAPEFANDEQDIIRQSFSTGNHTWMKESLPVELAPDSINQLRRQRMEKNRLAEPLPQTWSKMTQLWGGGCYQEFEYIPDEYQRKGDFSKGMREQSNEKRGQISNHDWRYASQERRQKHETMINDPRNKEPYPYLGGDKDLELPAGGGKWLRSNCSLGTMAGGGSSTFGQGSAGASESSFLAGKGRGLEDESRGSRMTLPTAIQRLQKRLDADWEGTTVVVSATDQDLVQIAFHMKTVDSERGVSAYMNVLSKDPELLGALGLRKVSQLWGMKRNFASESAVEGSTEGGDEHTWMFYILTPKWVRMRPTDSYYTTHPRSQGSAFRMSTAGSSVLLSLGSTGPDTTMTSRQKPTPRGGSRSDSRNAGVDGDADDSRYGGGGADANKVDLNAIERAVGGLPAIREAQSARGQRGISGGGPQSARR